MNKTILFAAFTLLLACDRSGTDATTTDPTTPVFQGLDGYDAIAVQDGFIYVELPGTGVARCPIAGCASPTPIVDSAAFVASAADGAKIVYATQIASDDGSSVIGSIHSVQVDGSGDQSLLDGLAYPAYLAASGDRVFWARDSFAIDETPASIECIGCGGTGSTPWLQLQGGTYGMLTDGANVYVLADDATHTTLSLFSCPVDKPCYSEPNVVLGGLTPMTTIQQIATDGASVYVARENDVVRVDAGGAQTPIVQAAGVTALVVDRATSTLYYGKSTGEIGRVKTDGTASVALGSTGARIGALDVDATSLYLLTGASSLSKMAK